MQQEHLFARDEVAPSWWANAIQGLLSVAAFQFRVSQSDATHLQVIASANEGAAVISIAGLWRWNEATITVAHPGGAPGAYPVFVTAINDNIVSTPAPYTDDTNRAFGLTIVAPGATPPIVAGTVDQFRQVAVANWDGAQITSLTPLVPAIPAHAGTHATGGSDPLTLAEIGAAAAADLATEITNRATADSTEFTNRTNADTAEATARANAITTEANARASADTTEAVNRSNADTTEATARVAGDNIRIVHVATMDDQTSPPQLAGSVIGHVPVSKLGSDSWSLVGIITRAMVAPSGAASTYKVQTDNGSGTGVLADAVGTNAAPVTPVTGRAVRTGRTGGALALADLDTVAVVLVTPGTTKGISIALEFQRTSP